MNTDACVVPTKQFGCSHKELANHLSLHGVDGEATGTNRNSKILQGCWFLTPYYVLNS
jgi:hypothetical protein